ncbi:MAG TPA: tetratricopeptide repeat protein [Planctomycetaceae bacterium]
MPDQPHAVDVTAANFQQEVVEASKSVPVVVDFWAAWCGPCRQLGPLLDRLAAEFAGRFRLVKVNTEEAPDLAGGFGVSSIPYVVAVRDGQIVDEFVGLLPEPALRAWIERLLPSPVDELLAKGKSLEESDPASAERTYREAAALAPQDDRAKIALARVLLAQNRDEESRSLVDELSARGFLEPEAEQIKSQLDLRAAASEAGGVEEARRAAEADPGDLSLKIRLADALAVSRRHEEAMNLLLDVIRADRSGHGDAARESMVKIFDLLGPQHPLVSEYRRKLATALY